MDTTSTLDHCADDDPAITPVPIVPTAAELRELAYVWADHQVACGEPGQDQDWSELSAVWTD